MEIVDIKPLRIKVNHRGDWILVVVETDNGIKGLGEASHSGDDDSMIMALRRLKGKLSDKDPLNIETIIKHLKTPRRAAENRIRQIALSAIEQALWDIMGQYLNVPIHTLLGGCLRNKIRLYANLNRSLIDRTPEGFAAAASRAVDEGFTAVKIAPFDELTASDSIRTGSRARWQLGVERIRKVRDAIGDEVELAVDCHGRMDISQAVAVAEAVADCQLLWLEEPVPMQFTEALKTLSSKVTMPIAAGESLFEVEGFRSILAERTVDIVMPDVKWDGGLLETKLIAGAARMNQILVAPHSPAGPVSTVASAQVASTMSNFLILEYAWAEVGWRAELLSPPEKIENGYLILSDRPGLGHRLNEKTLGRVLQKN
ncbi:MAG: mandelate racemase/muconate lactonizing enzyme family protein [Deltaproteobacteria bacterium]|nr:mandelate racemase/muconate lactonizing enzyme family protein [Deltaproteobacteria bacterium]